MIAFKIISIILLSALKSQRGAQKKAVDSCTEDMEVEIGRVSSNILFLWTYFVLIRRLYWLYSFKRTGFQTPYFFHQGISEFISLGHWAST